MSWDKHRSRWEGAVVRLTKFSLSCWAQRTYNFRAVTLYEAEALNLVFAATLNLCIHQSGVIWPSWKVLSSKEVTLRQIEERQVKRNQIVTFLHILFTKKKNWQDWCNVFECDSNWSHSYVNQLTILNLLELCAEIHHSGRRRLIKVSKV